MKYIVLFLIVFSAVSAAAQTEAPQRQDFFIAPLVEVVNSRRSPGFGTGLAIGAGSGVAMGARLLYVVDFESINALELAAFMRFYPLGPEACSGPFFQINTGAVIFARRKAVSFPTEVGALSAVLLGGWRFLLKEHWYVEPVVRVGYPYLYGVGASAGYRF